jgi:putative oxidoreductase
MNAPVWVDFLRVAVGAFIVFKGVVFVLNIDLFVANISSVGWIYVAAHLAHVIIFVHLVCGVVLVAGAYTRVMSLLNIPILAGAVIFNYKKMLTADNYMELEIAIGVLVVLILVFIMGGGRFSLDGKRSKNK